MNVIYGFMALINVCCSTKVTENKEFETFKVDTMCLKKSFLNIVDSYCLHNPSNKSITIYSKFYIEGSEGLCAYSEDPSTYYVIGPSEKCMFEKDKNGNQVTYPISWFKRNNTYIFLQSGQDVLFANKNLMLFYESKMESKLTPKQFSKCSWLIKTTRDSTFHVVSKQLSKYLECMPIQLKTPLRVN